MTGGFTILESSVRDRTLGSEASSGTDLQRQDLLEYVSRLVKLRTSCLALGVKTALRFCTRTSMMASECSCGNAGQGRMDPWLWSLRIFRLGFSIFAGSRIRHSYLAHLRLICVGCLLRKVDLIAVYLVAGTDPKSLTIDITPFLIVILDRI